MDAKNLLVCAKRLHPCQVIHLSLKEDAIAGVGLLIEMYLKISYVPIMTQKTLDSLGQVFEDKKWGSVSRIVSMVDMCRRDAADLTPLVPYLESISRSEHIAMLICEGSYPDRCQAMEKINAGIFTNEFITETRRLGLKFFAILKPMDGLEVLEFQVMLEDKLIATVYLDGWSGRSLHENSWSDECFVTHKSFQDHLRMIYTKALERRMTTTS